MLNYIEKCYHIFHPSKIELYFKFRKVIPDDLNANFNNIAFIFSNSLNVLITFDSVAHFSTGTLIRMVFFKCVSTNV